MSRRTLLVAGVLIAASATLLVIQRTRRASTDTNHEQRIGLKSHIDEQLDESVRAAPLPAVAPTTKRETHGMQTEGSVGLTPHKIIVSHAFPAAVVARMAEVEKELRLRAGQLKPWMGAGEVFALLGEPSRLLVPAQRDQGDGLTLVSEQRVSRPEFMQSAQSGRALYSTYPDERRILSVPGEDVPVLEPEFSADHKLTAWKWQSIYGPDAGF